ncbi:hypothetical protein Patl1_22289 [Pistacia atlantica]|uniref:Uncharacterized protein n=1 Tax=Pistacia atlantica TaxID=434234 RepID=A0ACC0ZXB2_9ROSI|nr:hypothetical protein Patl1_22289 [Pistacia atlantica]
MTFLLSCLCPVKGLDYQSSTCSSSTKGTLCAVRDEVERVILPFIHQTARGEQILLDLNFCPAGSLLLLDLASFKASLHGTSFDQAETSEKSRLRLVFDNKLPSPIFTGSKIEAEDGAPVRIALMDTSRGTVVKSGPLSSMKIEILVLDGDFCSDDQEDWSENEFRAKLVREREGKRPLVTGELIVTLKEGVGIISDVVFTDNSSWMRCRKFRLGARVMQRNSGDVRIQEARSEPFMVKDHRGELYKKHYPPSLDDEVWRLEKIAKDGTFHERLADKEVKTVRAFLQLHTTNPKMLRNMLNAPTRTWETIVEHAITCVVDDEKLYAYSANADGVILLFNSIYKPVAASFDGKVYQSIDNLNSSQKFLVENLKKHAYKHVQDFFAVDARAILGPQRSLMDLQAEQFNSPTSILQHHEFPVAQEMLQDLDHASISTSNTYQAVDCNQFQLSLPQNSHHPVQMFSPMLRNSFKMAEFFPSEDISWPLGGSQGQIVPNCNLGAESISPVPLSTWSLINPAWESSNSFFLTPSNESELGSASSFPNFGVHMSRTGNPRAAWCKIKAAVKWGSVRRHVAAKRMARPFCVNQLLSSSIN